MRRDLIQEVKMNTGKDWVSVAAAAHRAGVAASTIYRWCANGRLSLYKRGSRTCIDRRDLDRLLAPTRAVARHQSGPPQAA
jgi:excisionase family DNA binding protein